MKSIRHIQKCFSPFLNLLCFIIFLSFSVISCGGGGGGAASASLPASEYTTHNPGGWGGGGSSGGSSSGGTSGGSSSSEVEIQGFTPLTVTGYIFNGTTYPDLTSLTLAMSTANATGSFTVPFTVSGESTPRTARVTKTNEGYSVEHQYKAILSTGDIKYYYANDGVDLSNETTGTIIGWKCNENGITYNGSHISGVNGDIHLAPVYDWKIDVGKPSSATDMGGDVYKITDFTTGFLFEAKVSDGTPIQNVETCTWTVNSTNLSETNTLCTITPSGMGLSASNIGTNATNATPVTITCNVTVAGAAPQAVTKTIKLYKEPELPDFLITNYDGSSLNIVPYKVHSMTETLSFSLSEAGNFPPGTQFEWSINGEPLSGQTGDSCSINATDMGFTDSTIPTTAANAATVSIECIAMHPDVDAANNTSASAAFDIWKELYNLNTNQTSIAVDDASITLTVTGATGLPTVTMTPSTYLDYTAPVQDLSDTSKYTIAVTIKDGTAGFGKVWFNDNTSVDISVTDPNGATSNAVSLSLINKYKYQLKKSNGTNVDSAVTVASGDTLTFDDAKNAVGTDSTNREIVGFKKTQYEGNNNIELCGTSGPSNKQSITFNSSEISSRFGNNREITLWVEAKFHYSVTDSNGQAPTGTGTQADPYILTFGGTAAQTSLHVSSTLMNSFIDKEFDTPNVLTEDPDPDPDAGAIIGIALTEAPASPVTVTVTLTDERTGASHNFYVKVQGPVPAEFVTVTGGTVSGQIADSQVFIAGRTVTIRNLSVCAHEVTQEEYLAVMGSNPSNFSGSPAADEVQSKRPVEYVSWYDALIYCNKRSEDEGLTACYTISGSTNPADWGTVPTNSNDTWNAVTCNFDADGYRLPTEAEWEYVARGGNGGIPATQTTYSGSDTPSTVGWCDTTKTHQVMKKTPNSLGIYDMTGNVLEWCWDWSDSLSSSTPDIGPENGDKRVVRGGSWNYAASNATVSYRKNRVPNDLVNFIGFRVVRTVP